MDRANMSLSTIFLVLQLVLASSFAEASSSCEPGWVRHRNSCYLFSRNTATWAFAQIHCSVYGAKLAEIESNEEDSFLRIYAMDTFGHGADFWVGGTDDQQEGHWIWVEDRVPVNYTNWYSPNPSNTNGNEHCMEIRGFVDYKWNDWPCTYVLRFLCEEELDVRKEMISKA